VIVFLCLLALESPTVTRGDLTQTIVLDGKITAAESEVARAPLTQTWEIQLKWLVPEGSHVRPGDVLARFDNSGVLGNLESLQAELQNFYSERNRKLADAASAIHEQEIAVRSAEIAVAKAGLDAEIPEGIIEQRTLQEYKLALIRAENELEKARKELTTLKDDNASEIAKLEVQIKAEQDELERITGMADKMEIRAETSGYVLHGNHLWEGRKLEPGDQVRATWPVVTIPDMSSLEVEAWVGETRVTALEPGQPVSLVLDAYPDRVFTGRVLEVSGRGEKQRRRGKAPVYRVRVGLDDGDPDLMRPGMSIRTRVTVHQTRGALLVPIEAVDFRDGRYWVRPDGGAPVSIEPLAIDAFHIAVAPEAGLREGMCLSEPTGEVIP